VIYTRPIDRFFNHKYRELGWRTLDFESEIIDVDDYQGTAVMNYAEQDMKYTRIHEFKHYHPERDYAKNKTIIFREYSRFAKKEDEPYYPINTKEDKERFEKYKLLKKKNAYFGGRLGEYMYYDMDDSITQALNFYYSFIN
ncbi:MAG: UDP-galactopyranose mutase, partial [Spirochaetes bacterium]|nr:UDP-galactopyranose mutase [Spirochaetota bacterium]